MPLSLLVLINSLTNIKRVVEVLKLAGYTPDWQQVQEKQAVRESLARPESLPDLCLVADDLPELSVSQAVALVRDQADDIPIIVIVEPTNEPAGLAAMRAGATDLLYWDRLSRLAWSISRTMRNKRKLTELEQTVSEAQDTLLEAERARYQMAAGMAQELRTPISTLSLYIHLLERGSLERKEEYLLALRQQVEALNKLLQGSLSKAHPAGDEPSPDREEVNLNKLVMEVVSTYRLLAEASGLDLQFLAGAGLPEVQGQPQQLIQAVANLLLNAIRYTPSGRIDVKTYLNALRGEVCLEVRDTGLGISREDMAHLFDPYYRGKSASEQHVLGEGLGLAVAKEIVEEHGGSIDARSEEQVGSIFTICLPAVIKEVDSAQRRILIVENSKLMRKVLRETLEQDGYDISLAEHGLAALKKMDSFRPDLILSDVAMPEMDGYAFLDAVRSRPDWQDVPFIFITGQSDQIDFLQSQASRGASYLLKPIVIEELLTAVRARLS